jgi:HSP20 family protein
MASQTSQQEVAPREKRELTQAEERTEAGKFFSPHTDIHETERAVLVMMEMPGVGKDSIDIQVEKGVLTVKGTIDPARYESVQPLYTEYNVGNYQRRFSISSNVDAERIEARITNGVLELRLPKAEHAKPRKIAVNAG